MKVRLFLFILCFGATFLSAELQVHLAYHQEELYFLDSAVELELRIVNSGVEAQTIFIADDIRNSLDIQIRTVHGRLLSPSLMLVRSRNRQRIPYRSITLLPDEQFVRIVALSDFTELSEIGLYSVQAMFYRELYNEKQDSIDSNILQLAVRPGTTSREQSEQLVSVTKQEILIQEDLHPDEIVLYTIRARQDGDWNRFFTYLDIESLLLQNPEWKRRYLNSSESIKLKILDEFRISLQQERVEENISVVPSSVKILKTEYGPIDGTVLTEQAFRQSSFEVVKQFRYYFERSGYWKITAYDVLNVGTRALSNAQ